MYGAGPMVKSNISEAEVQKREERGCSSADGERRIKTVSRMDDAGAVIGCR
jgi:hypothetical protein